VFIRTFKLLSQRIAELLNNQVIILIFNSILLDIVHCWRYIFNPSIEHTLEMPCITIILPTRDTVQQNIFIIKHPLSQTFTESLLNFYTIFSSNSATFSLLSNVFQLYTCSILFSNI